MKRVLAYIDGYNLYHALKDNGWQKYYWLNIAVLMNSFIENDSVLRKIYYFTAISHKEKSKNRQRIYLNALETEARKNGTPLFIKYGHFKKDDIRCVNCNELAQCHNCEELLVFHHEKQTDVNISVQMMVDAYEDNFDIAFLVTADSDQAGTIESIIRLFPEKIIFIIFPPKRFSDELKKATGNRYLQMSEKRLKKCQLANEIAIGENKILARPKEWN